jgi:crotonobetainyl-CoA:carnitine CoA-transferase CaiB-like acyl-CoA transferase
MMPAAALDNIKVIDLTHYIAGPYCTKLLAGFGAEVIKIERPGTGDPLRGTGPFFHDQQGLETSIPFLWLNTVKKSITLNLKAAEGKEIFTDLVRDADLVVENFAPGVMARLGLDYASLRKINPSLVMTSISNFGQTGRYRDFKVEEMELQALSGLMYLTGDPSRAPLAAGPAICQYSAGQNAYLAALMALLQRGAGGEGQYIDVSIMECALENIEIAMTSNLHTCSTGKRGPHMMVPWGTYECRDGYASVIAMPYRHWHKAAGLFADQRLFDRRYELLRERIKHREEYEALLRPCVREKAGKELFHEGQRRNLAFGYVAGFEDVFENPQHLAREFFVDVDHPATGRQQYCNAPFRMAKNQWLAGRAPLLGEDNERIYGQSLGYSTDQREQWRRRGVI